MTDASILSNPGDGFVPLTDAECRALLGTRTFGRIGMTSGGLPVILPVRYIYADDTITFRTGNDVKLRAAGNGDVLAFEVDAYDAGADDGWTVLVLGRATVLTTEHEHDGLPTLDPPSTGRPRSHYVRLNCELLSGRRLTPPIATRRA